MSQPQQMLVVFQQKCLEQVLLFCVSNNQRGKFYLLKPCRQLSFVVVVLVCILFGCLHACFCFIFLVLAFRKCSKTLHFYIVPIDYLLAFPFRNEYFTAILHSLNHCMPAEQFYKLRSFLKSVGIKHIQCSRRDMKVYKVQ